MRSTNENLLHLPDGLNEQRMNFIKQFTSNLHPVVGIPSFAHTASKRIRNSEIQSYTANSHPQETIFVEENMLLFVLHGSLTIRHGRSHHKVEAGSVAFLRKKISVDLYSTACPVDYNKRQFVLVTINNDTLKTFTKNVRLTQRCSLQPAAVSVNNFDPEIKSILKNQIETFDSINSDQQLVESMIIELLARLAKNENDVIGQLLYLRDKYVANITSVVEQNIMNNLSLSELARLSGRSLSSFRRDFQAIYNMSPSEWIRHKRLEKAAELLRSTTMTVTDICFCVGFENIAHFSRLFKQSFHSSPLQFRANQGKIADRRQLF